MGPGSVGWPPPLTAFSTFISRKDNSHSYTHLILALGIAREPTVWGLLLQNISLTRMKVKKAVSGGGPVHAGVSMWRHARKLQERDVHYACGIGIGIGIILAFCVLQQTTLNKSQNSIILLPKTFPKKCKKYHKQYFLDSPLFVDWTESSFIIGRSGCHNVVLNDVQWHLSMLVVIV